MVVVAVVVVVAAVSAAVVVVAAAGAGAGVGSGAAVVTVVVVVVAAVVVVVRYWHSCMHFLGATSNFECGSAAKGPSDLLLAQRERSRIYTWASRRKLRLDALESASSPPKKRHVECVAGGKPSC